MTSNHTLRRILAYALVLLILIFMGRALYFNWHELQDYTWNVDYPLLAGAVFAGLLTLSLYAWAWRLIVRSLGADISYAEAFRIWFLSNLGRYIPGKVWQFVGWFYLGEQAGIGRVQVLTSIAVNLGLQVLSGLGLGLATLIIIWGGELRSRFWPLLALLPLGIFLSIQPRFMGKVLNWGLQRLGREPIALGLRGRDMALFLIVHIGCWTSYAIAFYLFVRSVYPLPLAVLPTLGATYAASWVIGFLSLLTPGGIGVREGVMAYLLSFFLPPSMAIVVSLLSRLWITASELIGTGIAWRIRPSRVSVAQPSPVGSTAHDA